MPRSNKKTLKICLILLCLLRCFSAVGSSQFDGANFFMPPYKDYSGQRFGRLVVLSRAENLGRKVSFLCLCDCGNEKVISSNAFKCGTTISCGCWQVQTMREQPRRLQHGQSIGNGSPEYQTWSRIKSRCYDPNEIGYHRYGGRGITVCDRWLESFENFLSDMGERPSQNHSIDREDNDGNYEPSNCKWSTKKEQANNRRSNRILSYKGQDKTTSQWADEIGIGQSTIHARLKRGWSIKKTLSTTYLLTNQYD